MTTSLCLCLVAWLVWFWVYLVVFFLIVLWGFVCLFDLTSKATEISSGNLNADIHQGSSKQAGSLARVSQGRIWQPGPVPLTGWQGKNQDRTHEAKARLRQGCEVVGLELGPDLGKMQLTAAARAWGGQATALTFPHNIYAC